MSIRLQDEELDRISYERLDNNKSRSILVRLINSVRIYNVPLLNFTIIVILASFLFKLTTKYTELYMRSSLITIIVTNLVLYGISETLAQSLLSYRPRDAYISFRFNDGLSTGLSFNLDDVIGTRGPIGTYTDDEINDEIDDEGIERFINYIQEDEESLVATTGGTNTTATTPILELSYFQFNRLAGFMCWGFILAFVQCWWYKFLQIYSSKDPKFIEVLRKVLTDQLCYSPVSLFCFFTYGTMVLESGTWEDTKAKLLKLYFSTLVINYSIWFPIQFFNFLIVPRSFQVPFSSSIAVLWNCFLLMRNSNA